VSDNPRQPWPPAAVLAMLGMSARGQRLMRFGIGILTVPPTVEHVDRRTNHHSDPGAAVRAMVVEAGRLEVAIAACVLGYALLDTVEVADGEDLTGPGWARVHRLAVAVETDALLVHGPVNPAVAEPFAAKFRLVVRAVRDVLPSPPFHPSAGPSPGLPGTSSDSPGPSGWLGAWGAAPQPPSAGRTGQ
jgi:hypothetical protein